MILRIGLIILLLLAATGCRRALERPEASDPVYRDLRREANMAYGAYKDKEKKALEARKAFEEAPIRTAIRLQAQEDYFALIHEEEKVAQKYRYLALKAELRQKYDVSVYPRYFKENKPWPDQEQYKEYETEKRLVNAPREWDPEQRIKQRELASKTKKTATENTGQE